MNRDLEPEGRRGLMSPCIVSCRQFNDLFPSLTVLRFEVFKNDWRLLANRDARSPLLATRSMGAIGLWSRGCILLCL